MDAHDEESLGSNESPLSDESPGVARAEGEHRFRWRPRYTVLAVLAVIAVCALIASLVSIPYYAITPGTAQSVERLIAVPKARERTHAGQVMLVDVELTPLRAIEWPYFALDSNAQIVSSTDLLGTGVSAEQYQIEGTLDMSDAQQAATVVALRQLGYKISVNSIGSLVYSLLPNSPAAHSLAVGEIITALDGRRVPTYTALGKDLSALRPGSSATLGVLTYPNRATKRTRVQLSAWRVKGTGNNATLLCPPYGTDQRYPLYRPSGSPAPVYGTTCMGVDLEPSYHVGKLPFKVDMSSEDIIGPSAGLAFTLGLIERLDRYDLTGGHKIAATGTMDIYGQVGDVGGVAQKTVAVRASGAKAFFVPPQEYKVALAHAGHSLKVYAVSSVAQAIQILVQHYGGRLPSAP